MLNPLMNILYIEHKRDNKIIFRQENVHNMIHFEGEEFILNAVFVNPSSLTSTYYLGLDYRTLVSPNDTMASITGEQFINGYTRALVPSSGSFTLDFDVHWRAKSPIITFQCTIGGWGPVRHLFLTDQSGTSGKLISTSSLESDLSLIAGDQITCRLQMALKFCP